jgi:hypothetical protein
VSARKCACGCGVSLDGMRSDAVWASESCRKAVKHGERRRIAARTRPHARSGLQLSYRKAVEAIVKGFSGPLSGHWATAHLAEDDVRQSAEIALASVLPRRQLERLVAAGEFEIDGAILRRPEREAA